jgi:hypothetical protein
MAPFFKLMGKISIMKKIWIAAALFIMANSFVYKANAQVQVSINIGAQPSWGPAGYNYAEYYYMPDIESYYYVPSKQYIYLNGPKWVYSTALPPRYSGYDIYRGYKVVINEPKPFLRHDVYKTKYMKYKGAYGKQVIIKNNPGKGHGNGNGNGKAKGKSKGHK